jgi:uncharacterized protein YbjT (DUF2867 family)
MGHLGWKLPGNDKMGRNEMRILVIGGTGFLGQPIAKALMKAGHPVRILARDPEKARRMFGADVDVVRGDVAEADSLRLAMEGCYGVHVSLHGYRGKENFYRVEHRGVESVAKVAAEGGVKHITMISGANVCRDETVYFVRAKYLGEQALLDGEVPATILRASWFMESLPLMVKGKLGVIVGRQPHPIHFIALKDLARMVVGAFVTPEAGNKVMEAYGPERWTVEQALAKYCRAMVPGAVIVHMPLWVFWVVSQIGGGRLPFLYDLMALLDKNPEPTDCGGAVDILGPNTITLDQWIAERRGLLL